MGFPRTRWLLAAALLGSACGDRETGPPRSVATTAPTYVGREVCASCHVTESGLHRGSQHDRAMEEATDATVLGDFSDRDFAHDGVTSRFSRRDGHFDLRTVGADGRDADFAIPYTFGVDPLQQYLVAGERGRLQALTVAWDTRSAEAGGQRWFSLYPDESLVPGDPLHWTGTLQNWNFMCAECHSTDLKKNYDLDTDTYRTTWSELDVSCEACHGPASEHVAWAEAAASDPGSYDAKDDGDLGLVVRLRAPWGDWEIPEDAPTAVRRRPLESAAEVETCGRCHSRRTQFAEDERPGESLEQAHLIAYLNEGLYFPDGQIQDEVYVYGSFLQSKMHGAGVICTDCHEPHAARLLTEGNALCARCHRAETFDTPAHHHHPAGGPGANCVDCHMPSRTYMVVDPRRDHSLRIPRPDLTLRTGSPNACSGCHADHDARWALDRVNEWYGGARADSPHHAIPFHAARRGARDAGDGLRRWAADPEAAAIVRATALELLQNYPAPENLPLLQQATQDPDPLVRRAAAESLVTLPPQYRLVLGMGLLDDPVRSVRLAAVLPFAEVPAAQMPDELRASFERAAEEYRAAQRFNADRPEGLINLGNLEVRLGNRGAAEDAYRRAMELHPWFLPAYVNLADVLRDANRDRDGEVVLRSALEVEPDNAEVHHALGLLYIRMKRLDDARTELREAARLRPENPRFAYVHAVALYEAGARDEAVQELAIAFGRHPEDADLAQALVSYHHEMGNAGDAGYWARKLLSLRPGDPEVMRWLDQLGVER